MQAWTVYLLIDPRDGEIRYVGGSKHPKERYRQHLYIGNYMEAKWLWIQELKRIQKKPIFETLIICDTEEEMIEREIYWTRKFREIGCQLTNNKNRRRAHSDRHPLYGPDLVRA